MAVRLEVDPFMFMQNTYTSPDGKPAMEGKLAIALINARGPFVGGVQFEYSGEGDDYRMHGVRHPQGRRQASRASRRHRDRAGRGLVQPEQEVADDAGSTCSCIARVHGSAAPIARKS